MFAGMLETVRIRREGYAIRLPFDEFLSRYQVLGFKMTAPISINKTSCETVLRRAGTQGWLMGCARCQ